MLACFIDGTDMSMSGFDRKKEDGGYAGVLENTKAQMASSDVYMARKSGKAEGYYFGHGHDGAE